MNFETRNLLDKLIKYYGGSYERINRRLFWHAPDGKAYHVSPVFLKRMVSGYKPKEVNEVDLNGRTEEVATPVEEVKTERNKESPKKKKDRPKKTIPKVENEEKSGTETKITTEEKDENI